jgi:hypothetical protein
MFRAICGRFRVNYYNRKHFDLSCTTQNVHVNAISFIIPRLPSWIRLPVLNQVFVFISTAFKHSKYIHTSESNARKASAWNEIESNRECE